MTLLNRWLAHLIHACLMGQKSHAWLQAQHLAQIYPQELAALPEMLIAAMKSSSHGRPEHSLQTHVPTGEQKRPSQSPTSRLAGR